MLDKDKDGFLSPGDARYWLRCVGWCCTDKELGVALKASKPSATCVKEQKLKEPDQHLASVPRLLDLLSSVTRGKLELDAATFYELMSTEGEPLGLEDLEELMGVIGFGANRLGGNVIDIRSLADTLVSKILVPPCVPTQRSKYAA
eukprot:g4910.t1